MFDRTSKIALITAISAFVLDALVDPADKILHAKVPLFACLFCIWLFRLAPGIVKTGGPKIWLALLFFVLFVPGLASVVALTGGSLPDGEISFGILKACATLLLIPIVLTERIDLVRYIIRWSMVIAILTLAMVAVRFASPVIYLGLYAFTIEKSNAYISPRNMLGLGIGGFYYATIAVVVFPIAYWFRKLLVGPRKWISLGYFAVFLGAAVCSDSRAVAISIFAIIIFQIIRNLRRKAGIVISTIVFLATMIPLTGILVSFFSTSDEGNSIKLGHGSSYAVLFEDHPEYLIWGQGADTEFYSEATQTKLVATELTYLELIRQFGLPLTLLIVLVLIYPVVKAARMSGPDSYLAVPYAAYLFEAGTNPLLVSSTGLLVVSAVWAWILMRPVEPSIVGFDLTLGLPA